jgi:transposase
MNVTMIGFDLAKGVVQVHGVDGSGQVAVRKRLSRAGALAFFERLRPCVVGLEA